MPSQDNQGQISFRTSQYAVKRLLMQAKKKIMLSKWFRQEDIPANSGLTMDFRRYLNTKAKTNPIFGTENPSGSALEWIDFSVELKQYGTFIDVPQIMRDTHEDPVINVSVDKLAYHMAETKETLNYNVVKGGTNTVYAAGAANRAAVAAVLVENDVIGAIATLEGNDAAEVSELVLSTPAYNTESISPSYIAYTHTNMAPTIRAMASFIPFQKYAAGQRPMLGEVGTIAEKVRVVASNIALPYLNAGSGTVSGVRGTTNVDVYNFTIMAEDALAESKVSGKTSTSVKIFNAAQNGDSFDKLGLKGHVGYLTWHAAVILNNDYLVNIETAAPAFS